MKTNEIMKSVSLTFNKVGSSFRRRALKSWLPPAWSAWW